MLSVTQRVKKALTGFTALILLVAPQIAQAQNCKAVDHLVGERGDPFQRLALKVDTKRGVSVFIMGKPIFPAPAQDCSLYGPWQVREIGADRPAEKGNLECKWDFVSFDDADRLYRQIFDLMNDCLQENLTVDESGEKGKTLWRQKQMVFENDHRAGETIVSLDLIAWPPGRAETDTLWTPEHYWVGLEVEFGPAD